MKNLQSLLSFQSLFFSFLSTLLSFLNFVQYTASTTGVVYNMQASKVYTINIISCVKGKR